MAVGTPPPLPPPTEDNFQGAVDLASPINNAMRAFLAEMTDGRAAVQVGVTGDGRMMLTTYTPGGMIELLGLALSGVLTAWHQQQHQERPPS